MGDHYFEKVRRATGSRFWINNPTLAEIDLALDHGAAGCTTNPSYGGNLLARAPHEILPVIEAALAESEDDGEVAEVVQRRLVGRVCERFLPLYDRSGGREGFVSIQGAPEADTDGASILREGRLARSIAPNATPKIPATIPGLEALEALVTAGSPVIATEVFSLAQLIETCERWIAAAERGGRQPAFFVAPITGILGDHLRTVARREGVDVPEAVLEEAGILVSRACYRTVRDRHYPVTLLYGGARTRRDLSELVGGGMAATINWSTAAELLAADPPADVAVDHPVDAAVERLLVETFPDVRRALEPDALRPDEFEGFGPVQHFRGNFVTGWDAMVDAIGRARRGTPVSA
jgi:transaldolase